MTRVWPVIHVRSREQALRNAALVAESGAHGVFLIHMEGNDAMLAPIARTVMAEHPGFPVGVNHLSLTALESLRRSLEEGYDASWTDKPGVRSDGLGSDVNALAARLAEHPGHRFFGSVAFKYQPLDADPPAAALRAVRLGMVPTTSGVATGQAAAVTKIAAMREALGPLGDAAPLALASGITPENVSQFTPFVTDLLVSTGIALDFHELDAVKLRRLLAAIQA